MTFRVNTSRGLVRDLSVSARQEGHRATDLAGTCTAPVELHMFGYPDKLLVSLGIEKDAPIAQNVNVRCRKCSECLRHRARLWTARGIDECKFASRTWFGTITLSPDRQFRARLKADTICQRSRGERLSSLPPSDQFTATVKQISPDLTKWLKRVRAAAPDTQLRYLLVTEAHKSGDPHFHCLLHEHGKPIGKRLLESKWRHGFSQFRLVEAANPAAAGYVCKYLSKSALTRVRASKEYGQPPKVALSEALDLVLALTRATQERGRITPVTSTTGSGE